MNFSRLLRALPSLIALTLMGVAARSPARFGASAAPPPQLQPPCDQFSSQAVGDSTTLFADGAGIIQPLPTGLSVAACSLRTESTGLTWANITVREWDPTTLAPDPNTIALRTAMVDPSWLQYNPSLPRVSFVPPVVTLSVAGVAEPPRTTTSIEVSTAQPFVSGYRAPIRGFFAPNGPAGIPAGSAFAAGGARVPLVGPHPVLAHAVCSGTDDLAALRIAQSVRTTNLLLTDDPRELVQRFRVPEAVELRWVELAYRGQFGVPARAEMPVPTGVATIGIVDGAGLSEPSETMPTMLVAAPFNRAERFGEPAHWASHFDFDRTIMLEPGRDYWIYARYMQGTPLYARSNTGIQLPANVTGIGPFYTRTDTAGPWSLRGDATLAFRIVGRPRKFSLAQGPESFPLRASPNPSPGTVSLTWSGAVGAVHLELYDARGRRVFSGDGGASGEWTPGAAGATTRPLPSGLYFVRARDSAGARASARVVIVR